MTGPTAQGGVRWSRLARRPAVVVVAVAALVAGGAAYAAAPVQVSSSTSPFATSGCQALDGHPFNYLNSEVEPMVSVDPTNPQHLVGAWQQDRWLDGGAHGLVAGYSFDGGATWSVSPQPFSACYHASGYSGPYLDYQRASDPWVSIGPGRPGSSTGSTVYAVSLSVNRTPTPGDPDARKSAIGGATSYDGGVTWTNVQTIVADPCGSPTLARPGYVCGNDKAYVFNDKESVTADPIRPGVAYAVWDRVVAPPASFPGSLQERAYFGPALLSTTTDYGQTWSTPRSIAASSSQTDTIGNQIVVDRQTGALYDFFALTQKSNAHGHAGLSVAFVKSSDGGATWTAPTVVAPLQTVGVSDPNNLNPETGAPPAPTRTGDIIPEAAINPTTGQLYVVWQDARWNGLVNDEVAIATSSDGGRTWSPPARVNAATGGPAFDPSVFVNGAGVVGVSYFQMAPTVSGNEPTTLFIRHATSPGSSSTAPAFDAPAPVDGPFNNLAAPDARGYFLGDYQGLVANASGFVPFYAKTRCADGGPTLQPSCRAIQSVLAPPDITPTHNNSTDVFAAPGS